jgi:hypothetical protein
MVISFQDVNRSSNYTVVEDKGSRVTTGEEKQKSLMKVVNQLVRSRRNYRLSSWWRRRSDANVYRMEIGVHYGMWKPIQFSTGFSTIKE